MSIGPHEHSVAAMVRLAPRLRPLWPYLKTAYTHTTRLAAPVSIMASQLRGGYLPRGVVDTIEEAAASTGGRCLVARPEEIIERSPPDGIPPGHPVFLECLSEVIPRVVVAELPGGRVLSPHSAVITGADDLVQELSWYFGTTHPHEHPLFLHPFPGMPLEVGGRLGVLATRGDRNYYHFLMDVIPRLGVLEACPDVAPPDLWYVPAALGFQQELLDMVGIGPEARIDSTEMRHVHAECLLVPAPPSMTVRNPPWVVQYLRRKLLPSPISRMPDRAVYVTRGDNRNNRSVRNEADLVHMLARRGFDVVDPEGMTVRDQIRTFAEASLIVAPHGAALTNLAFASPGATVIELFPAGAIVADYWKLASGVPGLQYRYLIGSGRISPRGRAQMLVSDVLVDLDVLSGMLDDVGWRLGGRP
jgi:hypothetical protein